MEPGQRIRVTSPRTTQPRARPRPSAQAEIDAQSDIGEIYMRSLLRSQLRLAAGILTTLALTVGMLPMAFRLFPGFFDTPVLGMPLSWVVLAFGIYPVLILLAWRYVRSADRNENAFTQVVERL